MERHKLFQLLAEQIKDYAVFLLDKEGKVASWGAGAQLMKGYQAHQILGRHFSIFYPPEAVQSGWPEHELEVAVREGRFEDEGFRVRKDGSRFWANVVITALRDEQGDLAGFAKITRDLTERRRHEEELRQSEERFRLLVEGVVDYAIYMLDPEGFVTSWNAGAERTKGYRRDEVIGRHFSNFYTPEDVDAGKPWKLLALARREGRAEDEGWRMRKNGDRYWARAILTAIRTGSGQLCGFAKVTQDLSQRRHIEELKVAATRINEFIAVLAHELRNPLAPIQNAVEVMGRHGLDDSVKEAMRQTIARQTERLRRVVDDMVDITRVTRGELAVDKKPLDLSEVLERSVEAAAPLIKAAGHKLTQDLPKEKLVVSGDLQRLVQVFSNLLNNAARYTPNGGSIAIRGLAERRCAVISVKDTGRGMTAEELAASFQMFVQGRRPLERVGEGMGVGLALARNIVELHGGSIQACSEGEGKGTEVLVRLPLSNRTGAPRLRPPEPIGVPVAPQRVLIVDDNVDAATTLNSLLETLGHETRVVHDGSAALKVFDEFRPQVVLLDIGLPDLNGYEVARRFRSRTGSNVRIVAVTGWGQPEDRKESAAAGFDLHVVKPIDEDQLRRILQELPFLPSGAHPPNGTVH